MVRSDPHRGLTMKKQGLLARALDCWAEDVTPEKVQFITDDDKEDDENESRNGARNCKSLRYLFLYYF